ncbi:MAG: serine/threonine-protein kinase [Thermoanaerobaculia bacterium]|nr:serine/threonine-protein kinase [Thermoanaerobaculia bacterium]
MSARKDWRRIEELFFQCVELPADERSHWLARECGDDESLRRSVEHLLAAESSAESRLEGIVRRAVEDELDPESGSEPGSFDAPPERPEHVGPYRVLEVLGEGGMGTVFLGERADGTYEQRVAIKVVKQGLLAPQASCRFERERQLLARIEHPAVARLLDGGTTPAGIPYLVMEFVDGEPIDRYCDRHRLSISERLRLFREVCAGVHAVHRNLVVHRDLKPSNILVAPDGQPKLLDFGISKLLEDEEQAQSTALTVLGQRPLTPEYASPEQIRDEPITTAVDVYAAGLLLHRLLTGDRPYPLPKTGGEELRRTICEVPAERPSMTVARLQTEDRSRAMALAESRATEPGRLQRQLAGDLDHIVRKALRKEPGERYASVERLSADIERHLEGLPVEARRGGWRYRAARFLRRNRVAVVAAASVVLALGLGLIGQAREAKRASREAERANREAERANLEARASAEVVDFLVELFDASDPTLTRDQLTARELLAKGVERIHDDLADQPLTQAHLMSTLGRVYHNRGLFPEADSLFAGALDRRQEHLATGHPDTATSHLDLADNLRVLGRTEEAMPHYEQALEVRREVFGAESLETAQVLNNFALGLIRLADYPRAEELLEKVLEIRRRELGDDYLVAQSLHNLTLIASRQGDYRAAVSRGRETMELKERVLPHDHPSAARTMSLIAGPLRELGDYAEAELRLRQALEIMRNAWGDSHLDVLAARGDLALLRHLQGDREAAEAEQRDVLALKQQHLGDEHREVAISLDALGRQLDDRSDLVGAEDFLRRSLDLRLRLYPEEHPSVAYGRHQLGAFLLRLDRLEAAEPLLRDALAARRESLPSTHPSLGRTLVQLADALCRQGSVQEATGLAREGLQILKDAFPTAHPDLVAATSVVASCGDEGRSPE